MTFSTWASLTLRGAPGRGSSYSPSSRASRNRERHLPTMPARRAVFAPPLYYPVPRHMPAPLAHAAPVVPGCAPDVSVMAADHVPLRSMLMAVWVAQSASNILDLDEPSRHLVH